MPKRLTESRRLATEAAGPGRLKVGLITPGWGSSGYYSAKVLENAAEAKVIPAGTQMFLDHPGEHEMFDRPERSVRDLAAVTTEDAVWDGGGLTAEAQVFGPYRDLLTDETFAATIGVSIRAWAEATTGEAEGRQGPIITQLTEVESVDFVTKAGRGGSILAIMESARPRTVNGRAVLHGVEEATANDTRQALQNALTETYGGAESFVWVMDFDASTVWFQHETPDSAASWAEGYTLDGSTATLSGVRTEVVARTEYVPVAPSQESDVPAPAGLSTPTDSQEGSMGNIQVDEAELGRIRQDAERVPTLESELSTARAELARHQAAEAARPIAEQVVAESTTLTPTIRARVVRDAVAAVPAGAFDEAAFRAAVEAARTAAETELAEVLEAQGVGRITGFGSVPTDGVDYAKAAESAVAGAFGRTVKGA